MTINEYINDPNKSSQENLQTHDFYLAKLNAIIERDKKLPMVSIYNEEDDLWFHFKIPDEQMSGFYFDVIFTFHPNSKQETKEGNIHNYQVKFFSNDPGFVFRYCYEFNQAKLIIDPMKSRLNTRALTQPANQTNPNHELRYVKTIYFSYLVMEKLNLFDKSMIKQYKVTPLSRSSFVNSIPTDTNIYDKRNTRLKTVKNIDRAVTKITKPITNLSNTIKNSSGVKAINKISSIASSKKISGVKKTKRK